MRSGAALLILTVIVVALCIGSVRLDSATSDEPAYIAAGMIKLLHGRLDFFRDQPPLMNSISAAPLVIAGYRMRADWQIGGNHWAIGKELLYRSAYDGHRMLFLARLPTIALFVALCWAVFLFVAHHSGSRLWGLFAFTLTALCPNLMAHGRLATVDVPATFFSFAAAALFIRLIENPAMLPAIGVGVASGAAVLSKTSANILGPYFVLVLLIAAVTGRIGDRARVLRMVGLAAATALALIFVLIAAEGSEAYAAASFPHLPRVAVPFAEYIENVRLIGGWYAEGARNPQFLFGEFSTKGWPQYYPLALLLKMTIPALILTAMAAVIVIWKRHVPFAAVASIVFVALFLAIAAAGELALGIRYVLPVFPFLFAAIAIILSRVPRLGIAAAALLVWHAAENVRAYPSYISYFNQFIGSHRNADQYLIDSNLDWGQDLRRLDLWLRERGIGEVVVHYFGGGAPYFDLTVRAIGGYGPGRQPLPKGSWFALSRHFYRVSFDPTVSRENYDDYLARSGARFVTSIGGSINVYRVE